MSTSYTINYTDPLHDSFIIAPGGFNGPGGSISSSSLRLYGRGALEWGEAVDENLLRLNENFAGATPPIAPISGQLWYRQRLYCIVTAPTVAAGGAPIDTLFRFNFTSGSWDGNNHTPSNGFDVEVIAAAIGTYGDGAAAGRYVYSIADGKLYRWDRAYQQAAYSWLERVTMDNAINPNVPFVPPEEKLLVYNTFTDSWTGPSITSASTGATPVGMSSGAVWLNTSANVLNVVGDDSVSYPVMMGSSVPNTTNLNMGGNTIINIGGIGSPTYDVATKGYVDDAVNLTNLALTLDPRYVNITGDTMTGFLTLNADPTANMHASTRQYVHATVDAAIAASTATTASVFTSGTPAYKAGDIFTNGAMIWIAVAAGTGAAPGGNWKQVFPAAYG